MATSLDRVLDDVEAAISDGSQRRPASVSVDVKPGATPTLRLETEDAGVVTVSLSTDDARALGAALFRATTDRSAADGGGD